jgi:hypothetical protein
LRYIADVTQKEVANADNYDKSLLTLSSALLGISLTFIDNVVPLGNALWKWALVASWACFALTILTVLASIMYGQHCLNQLAKSAKVYFLEHDKSSNGISENIRRRLFWFNCANGAIFFSGVVLMVVFVSVNILRGESVMNVEKKVNHPDQLNTRTQVASPFEQYSTAPKPEPKPAPKAGADQGGASAPAPSQGADSAQEK